MPAGAALLLLLTNGAVPAHAAGRGDGTDGARAGSRTAAVSRADAERAPAYGRGSVVSVRRVDVLDRDRVREQLSPYDLDAPAAEYGVVTYVVVYRTIDAAGRPTVASGLVAVPRGGPRTQRVLAFEHGTTVEKVGAPSGERADDNRAFPLFYAGAGYFTVAPDYLGLGMGPGRHPYDHAASEASASVDLLRAAREAARREGVRLDARVLVTGFSQGGHAAMALAKALDAGADPRLNLGGLAPASGPYDLEGVMLPAAMGTTGDARAVNLALSYLVLGWNTARPLYRHPEEIFLPDQVDTVLRLFDGRHTEAQILAGLPDRREALFQAEFLAGRNAAAGRFRAAMRENDTTCAWRPRVPVVLFGARGDREVPFANTESCARTLSAHGTDVRVDDLGDIGHFPSGIGSAPRILAWFADHM
ncbi:lipase family protein [Embleya sp. MST-111070]|uniref:lipase family protein n=1 Tax=Embleya sp. MST-111070 TaxID=3398231 RepID=UPI003F73BF22